MKVLKICLIAVSMGIFGTSCHCCSTSATDSTTSSATTATAIPADGTTTAATPVTDTPATANSNAPKTETESGAKVVHGRAEYHAGRRGDTLAAKGPDMKAEKKREGNFTNGTGSDNPGK